MWESDYRDTAVHLKGLMLSEEGNVLDTASLDGLQPEPTMEPSSLLDDVNSDEKSGRHHSGLPGDGDALDVLEDSHDLLNLSLNSTDSLGSLPDLNIDELLANDSVFLDDITLGGLHEESRRGKEMGYFSELESSDEVPKMDSSLTRGSLSLSDPNLGMKFLFIVGQPNTVKPYLF